MGSRGKTKKEKKKRQKEKKGNEDLRTYGWELVRIEQLQLTIILHRSVIDATQHNPMSIECP